MDAKHTPGPWKIEMRGDPDDYDCDDTEGRRWASAVDISAQDPKDWAKFASVFTFCSGQPDPTGTANALLIVSAPELLAACEAMLAPSHTPDSYSAAYKLIEAAVAKAKGN